VAILGDTDRGPLRPQLVTSYADYQRWFGDAREVDDWMAYAVRGFFENGGQRAFISRIVGDAASKAEASFGDFSVRASSRGSWGNRVFVKIEDGTSVGFRLRMAYWGKLDAPFDPFTDSSRLPRPDLVEDFDDMVADESSPNFYGKHIGVVAPKTSTLGILVRGEKVGAGQLPAKAGLFLSGGADDAGSLDVDDYAGLATSARPEVQGLAALELDAYRDVSLVYAPNVSGEIAARIVKHCDGMRFRFAIIDSPKGVSTVSELVPRSQIADSSHAAFYYPWIQIADPRSGAPKLVPPGGHVMGLYARTDTERGVFKAPANDIIRGALGLEFDIDNQQQDVLNPRGVNVIRKFPGRGIRVWGSRTMSSNSEGRYVSVRRFLIYLERSICDGTQWVVFEPNDESLWARVRDSIRSFLAAQWRAGGLVGRSEQEAFFVSCDRGTMTQDDILNGRLICEIGLAMLKPAEFVVIRILQKTIEAEP
jgi:phage tail sheath protein FI